MKAKYRGFEIEVTRTKSPTDNDLIYGVAIDLSDDEVVEECPLEVDSVREGMDEMRIAVDYYIEDAVLFGGKK